MTLDELKSYQDQVANHQSLPSNVMDELFAFALAAIPAPLGIAANKVEQPSLNTDLPAEVKTLEAPVRKQRGK